MIKKQQAMSLGGKLHEKLGGRGKWVNYILNRLKKKLPDVGLRSNLKQDII